MWKINDFSVTQIFRENNFGDFRSAKSAIPTHLEALKMIILVNFSLQKMQKFLEITIENL